MANPTFRSSLEAHPDYVNAIGMITIEVGNMELALDQLLARMLGVGPDISAALYFTPKGAMARVEMMLNVANIAYAKDAYSLSQVKNLLLRARTVMGKRHSIIHDTWSLTEDGSSVQRASNPTKKGSTTPTPLKALTALIDDARRVVTEAMTLTMTLPVAKLPPYPGIHVGPTPPGSR